jgi:carbonic anhydrase
MDMTTRSTTSAFNCACCAGGPHEAAFGTRHSGLGRRRLLCGGMGAIAATVALGTAFPGRAVAQSSLSPDAALQRLLDGNKRFSEHQLTSFDEDLAILKENTVNKQEPYAGILSCADSRVPVELIFDQTIGHIFVTRVAGNTAGSTVIASLEYGAAVLGTKVIMVLGHANCGAVKAAMSGKAVPGQISRLFPATARCGGRPWQPGGGNQGQCPYPGQAVGDGLATARRVDQERGSQGRCGLLRARYRRRHPAELKGRQGRYGGILLS